MDRIEVTQADRDAAIPFAGGGYTMQKGYSDDFWIRRGDYDHHPLVQAFARHRIAALRNKEAPRGQAD